MVSRKTPEDPKTTQDPKKEGEEAGGRCKGKGRGGKEKGGKGTSGSGSGSEAESSIGKRREDTPEKDRRCIRALWGLCPVKAEQSQFGEHVHPAPAGICEHATPRRTACRPAPAMSRRVGQD